MHFSMTGHLPLLPLLVLGGIAPAAIPASGASSNAAAPASPLKANVALPSVNIVYFLGSDTEPVAGYQKRLSELLLHLQQFYGKEMERNGYGYRPFHLAMKDPGTVSIIVYKAKEPARNYPYQGGWPKVIGELNDYFAAHPGMKKSSHTLIIMPTLHDATYHDKNPGGVPFYGVGKNCFALDYPDFDLKHLGKNTPEGRLLTKWFGGLAHELGHGLNLPHNHQTTSDGAKLGTPLMGSGNYTFGTSPTYLTPATCAILDRCEVFANDPSAGYYTGKNPTLAEDISVTVQNDTLTLRGSYSGEAEVAAVNLYVQDPPYAVNRDYDAVSFTQKLGNKSGEFSFSIPKKELQGLSSDTFGITLRLISATGDIAVKQLEFSWKALEKGEAAPVNK